MTKRHIKNKNLIFRGLLKIRNNIQKNVKLLSIKSIKKITISAIGGRRENGGRSRENRAEQAVHIWRGEEQLKWTKRDIEKYMDLVVVELIENHDISAEKAVRLVKHSRLRKLFRHYPEEQFYQPVSAAVSEILENRCFARRSWISRRWRKIIGKKNKEKEAMETLTKILKIDTMIPYLDSKDRK